MSAADKKSVDLSVEIGGVKFRNPVMVASGTCGYGLDMEHFYPIDALGAIMAKGLSPIPWPGNPPPRIVETSSGMLNAIGLQNVGVDEFISEKLPEIQKKNGVIISNIIGKTIPEYAEVAAKLNGLESIVGVEINVSCPNIKEGGITLGHDTEQIKAVTRAVRDVFDGLVVVKLSPNVTDIVAMAQAAVEGGAEALSVINTLLGMAINAERRRPVLANVTGGLSGPAIKPVALRMVMQVSRAVDVPVIGMGGIMNATDAVEFMLAGATAVAAGTVSFVNPKAPLEMISGIEDYCRRHGFARVTDIIGALEV
jgi:dihydroorotate dehydrogenase (NAD+) catalytic subunit